MNHTDNLWYAAMLAWSFSLLLLNVFVTPLWFDPVAGRSFLFFLQAASPGGAIALWLIGTRHGNPSRIIHAALITCLFIYLVPILMLLSPIAVLIIQSTRGEDWPGSTAAMSITAALASGRIIAVAIDKATGKSFDYYLAKNIRSGAIITPSLAKLFKGTPDTVGPSGLDVWSIAAATAIGITAQQVLTVKTGSSKALVAAACITTPLAMHVISRMAVVAYLWIYRLDKFERKSGSEVTLTISERGM